MSAVIEDALALERLDHRRARAAREGVREQVVNGSRSALNDRFRVRRRYDGRPLCDKAAHTTDVVEVKVRRDQVADRLARRGFLDLRDHIRRGLVVGTGFEGEDVIVKDSEDAVVIAWREINIIAELNYFARRRRPFDLRQSFRRDK